MSAETSICQNCKSEFRIEPDDFLFYEKMKVPAPTWCAECRLVRRLAWRNERTLHRRICDMCKKSMVSVFAEDSGLTVYCSPCWWSDKWDAASYGVDVDFSKPFLVQVRELLGRVPVMNVFGFYPSLINSEFTNMVGDLKNCYLVTHSDFNENCAYGGFITNTKDSVDNLMLDQCELMYESVNCIKCYRTFYSLDCESCNTVLFSRNCVGCHDCFGCSNLRNKQYHIFNKPHTKEQYEARLKEYYEAPYEKREAFKKKAYDIWMQFPQKYMHEWHNTNVSGDYVYTSKNTYNSFIVSQVEDSRYCAFVTPGGMTDCYDFTHYGVSSNLLYESLQVGHQTSRILFSWFVISGSTEVEYSMFIIGCHHVFGAVGLKKKEYCILNKQYEKEAYDTLKKRIIEEMRKNPYRGSGGREYMYGEFFPFEMSPFGYNESTAQEFFPLTKEEVSDKGYMWREAAKRDYRVTVQPDQLPDRINVVSDDITNEIIGCGHKGLCNEQCSTAFKIIPQELAFYRKMGIPLPRLCPNCRHFQRTKLRNAPKFYRRQCGCAGANSENGIYKNAIAHFHGPDRCPNQFETSYAPERPEIVYCEVCYQAEVV